MTNPDGQVIVVKSITAGAGGTAVIADNPELNLTITDGSTDFAQGAFFEVFVWAVATAKVVAWDPSPASFDGRQTCRGILWDDVDASAADAAGVIVARDAHVQFGALVFPAAIAVAERDGVIPDLAALGIKAN